MSGSGPTATVATASTAETVDLGRRLAALLRPGDLVVLTGPLGAGKTALTRGIGAGLGVRGAVTSPTFVLAREHRPDPSRGGRVALVHVDAYRLRGPGGDLPGLDALEDLDLTGSLDSAVVVAEWGEGLAEALGLDHLAVLLERPEGSPDGGSGGSDGAGGSRGGGPDDEEAPRLLRLAGHGARWSGVDLAAALAG